MSPNGLQLTANGLDFLVHLLQLTQDMHVQARAGAWERVAVLESERSGLAKSYSPSQEDANSLETARGVMREILDLDARIMSLAAAAKQETAKALRNITQGRQALGVYQSVESAY